MGKKKRKIHRLSPKKQLLMRSNVDAVIAKKLEKKEVTIQVESKSSKIYVVERILGTKMIRNEKFYLVKWEGYGIDESTLVPADYLTDCEVALIELKRMHARGSFPDFNKIKLENFRRENILKKVFRLNLIVGKKIVHDRNKNRRSMFSTCTWKGFPIDIETNEPMYVIDAFNEKKEIYRNEESRIFESECEEFTLDLSDDEYEDIGPT